MCTLLHKQVAKAVLSGAKAGSLVLMDEMGSGTDPMQGAALAQSLLEVSWHSPSLRESSGSFHHQCRSSSVVSNRSWLWGSGATCIRKSFVGLRVVDYTPSHPVASSFALKLYYNFLWLFCPKLASFFFFFPTMPILRSVLQSTHPSPRPMLITVNI